MWLGARVVVVVPAWNEAPRIAHVLARLPAWVDAAVVVDDASTDATADVARAAGDPRVTVVRHETNRGVGAAIVTGYRRALQEAGGARASAEAGRTRDAFVVMAGDDQMDPADLPALVTPIADGDADYAKGTRFPAGARPSSMPRGRWLGGLAFSWATSRAIGVPVSDSQCGYTAISRSACASLDLDSLWPRYGYPNDLLSQLALRRMRICEVPVRAVYADEKSGLKPRHLAVIGGLVARAWWRRVTA